MFSFLFRRAERRNTKTGVPHVAVVAETLPAKESSEETKCRALDALDALGQDEAALLQFLLDCDVPAVRLAAAERIRGREHLERVRVEMRNYDRRVTRLVQKRLDDYAQQDSARRQAQALVEEARALCGEAIVRGVGAWMPWRGCIMHNIHSDRCQINAQQTQ